MIASLRGELIAKDVQGAVIECAGVGYAVGMSVPALSRLGAVGSPVQVLVHTQLSQDALRLFGFVDAHERDTFAILLGTSGVGPRLALAILSTLTPAELADVVAQGNKTALTRIPGVGPKKAERLLVELKGRFSTPEGLTIHAPQGSVLGDLLSALLNLGFAQPVAEQAARQAIDFNPGEMNLATLLRTALRATTVRH